METPTLRKSYFFLVVCCAWTVGLLTSSAADAGAVLAADIRGGLWKLGAQTPSKIRVGTLPAPITGLELTSSGELWGLEPTGHLWILDADTAVGVLMSPAAAGDAAEYRDLVELDGGDFVLLRWQPATERPELVRVLRSDGSREVLGEVTSSLGPDEMLDPHSLFPASANGVQLIDDSTFYGVELDELVARQLSDPVDFVAIADLSVDPESGTAWVLSERTEGNAGLQLVGVGRNAFDGIDATKPRYDFPFGLGPRAIVFQEPQDVCSQDRETLCLQKGRFFLKVEWADFDGNRGQGQVVIDRSETAGQFWFFSEDNRELMVKVIDACTFNGHFWVFLAGTTNVEFDLTVTDIDTFDRRVYSNSLGETVETVLDTAAFACANNVTDGGAR